MPFDRKTPELDAVAGKVVLEFVRHEHPERFEGFLKDTGKNEDEWERTVSISHTEFLKLQGLVYDIWGKIDPWRFVEVGRYITKTDNPAVSTAKKLGSTAAVVTLSGMKSNPKLNIDSEIRPLTVSVEEVDGKRIGRALIAHDNLGFVDEKYLTAPTTSAGYLSGIPTLWGFNPMNVQVRMVDQGLEDIIQNEFTGVRIDFTRDDKGNWLDNLGRTIAGRISLNETPYTNVPNKHKTYRIKESNKLFVGDPGRFLRLKKEDYEEVDYETQPMHKVYEDIFGTDENGNQVLVAKGGTYFGGPFSVYELEWEERPLNWISKLVVNITEWWRSGTSRDVMHEIARKETLENALKEKELELAQQQTQQLRLQMSTITRERMIALEEKEELKSRMYRGLHDSKHEFADLYGQALGFMINMIEMAEEYLHRGELEDICKQTLGDRGINSSEDLRKQYWSKGTIENQRIDTIDLFEIYNKIRELAEERKEDEKEGIFFKQFINFSYSLDALVEIGETGSTNIQERLDSIKGQTTTEAVDYKAIIRETLDSHIKLAYPNVKIGWDIPDIKIKGTSDDFRVIAFNVLDNACEAASIEANPEVNIKVRNYDSGIEIITENTGSISDTNLEKLNLAGRVDRFSTKRGEQGGYGTMAVSRILALYGGVSKYSRGENIVTHTARIPRHRII
ncbi:GHKL domain-containing protein [Candidatus Woesearchaeota archaeon]|nr:GHKL domain-containing protein [Candidatus Woesearchaeota archaeon]